MHYINGVRQSPFSDPHWTDGLSQKAILDTMLSNGMALGYLKTLTQKSMQGDYFKAITRDVFLEQIGSLDPYLEHDYGTAMILMIRLPEFGGAISFLNKEVGSLIRFDNRYSNDEAIICRDTLLEEISTIEINAAQTVELDMLLRKVGMGLPGPLPEIPAATEQEKYETIKHLTYRDIEKKPRRFYEIFKADMLAKGTPVNMTVKQFHEYAQKVLKPFK